MVSSAHLVVALVVVTFLDKTDCLSLQRPAQRPPTSSTTGLYLTRGETNGESRRKEVLASLDRRSWISSVVFSPACAAWSTMTVLAPPPPSVEAASMMPSWTLKAGSGTITSVRMPTLALNTVGMSVEDSERAMGYAMESGITHVDFHPGKERDGVALYLKNNPTARKSLFLTTKIRKAPPGTSPEDAAQRTRQQIAEDLAALELSQVDMLMLRDSPDCAVMQAQWAVLEEALKAGHTRSIGVINFCQGSLQCLLDTAKIKPAVHYFMLHVGMGQDPQGLRSFGESKGIRTFAYGAVGEPGPNAELLSSPILQNIGKAHAPTKSPEQVALRWVLQTGAAVSVRPSTNFGLGQGMCTSNGPDQCGSNLQARAASFDWKLTNAEMVTLDAMTAPSDNPTLFSSSGCRGAFVMPK